MEESYGSLKATGSLSGLKTPEVYCVLVRVGDALSGIYGFGWV